ncbi:MAG: beta-hexosaminidase, partial [Paracoccaceae bacterium]|nr:beta-hexosaminidase [Paracoccaceae bacterium]
RATAAITAGCDVILHCNGNPDEMQSVAHAAGEMTPAAIARAKHALDQRKTPENIDIPSLEAEFETLLG